ncbi:hypothetical protein DY000_02031803 [Brassica cretica]|uniref:Uncharacterized protein n=1 Tax=Brassica cretica TaxID=69181 RepID=A0ABQ7DN05_BRACR|nr:hypothetical protein DY000_02031803 [Brassica cretica]
MEKIRSPITQNFSESVGYCTLELLDLTSSAASFHPMLQINQNSSDFSSTTTFAREASRATKAERISSIGVLRGRLWARIRRRPCDSTERNSVIVHGCRASRSY